MRQGGLFDPQTQVELGPCDNCNLPTYTYGHPPEDRKTFHKHNTSMLCRSDPQKRAKDIEGLGDTIETGPIAVVEGWRCPVCNMSWPSLELMGECIHHGQQ